MAVARSSDDRVLLGVCGGLSEAFHIAPAWLRLAFVVATLASGLGVAVYVLLGLFMLPPGFQAGAPIARVRHNIALFGGEMRDGASLLRELWFGVLGSFTRPKARDQWRARLGGVIFVVGIVLLLGSLGLFWWVDTWRALAVVLILVGVGLLSSRLRADDDVTSEPPAAQ